MINHSFLRHPSQFTPLERGPGMAHARKKVLCVEDDRETAALIAEELVERGFEVRIAHNGQEGLLAILKDQPDLVLCDISMPIMCGFASAQIARKLPLAKRTVDFHIDNARIKLSAATRTEAAIKAAAGGLIKP
jgi:CheY-like chemotaxis protein